MIFLFFLDFAARETSSQVVKISGKKLMVIAKIIGNFVLFNTGIFIKSFWISSMVVVSKSIKATKVVIKKLYP